MEIDKFINFIQFRNVLMFTRGYIIDYVAENNDDWIFVLKALLIKNTKKFIHKSYLLEKLKAMKACGEHPYRILDNEGCLIYINLML